MSYERLPEIIYEVDRILQQAMKEDGKGNYPNAPQGLEPEYWRALRSAIESLSDAATMGVPRYD